MVHNSKEIPYFIQIEGCNNCKVREAYTTDTGTYYAQEHPLHAKCVHKGCVKYGFNVEEPFITPSEYIRMGKELEWEVGLNKAKEIIIRFFDFYDSGGNLLPWVVEAISQEEEEKPTHVKVAPPIN
jgi:hypothetical protein